MEEFKEQLLKVLAGEIILFKTSTLVSPDEASKILEEHGFEKGDMDTNGWDWDFWQTYYKDNVEYCLSGSGWYNRGLTFGKTTDK
jgi:hypothetical protein